MIITIRYQYKCQTNINHFYHKFLWYLMINNTFFLSKFFIYDIFHLLLFYLEIRLNDVQFNDFFFNLNVY